MFLATKKLSPALRDPAIRSFVPMYGMPLYWYLQSCSGKSGNTKSYVGKSRNSMDPLVTFAALRHPALLVK